MIHPPKTADWHGFSGVTGSNWVSTGFSGVTGSNWVSTAIFELPPREPNFEPPPSLKMLEGRIHSFDLVRRVKQLLTMLVNLARFTRWAVEDVRRWFHAVRATRSAPAHDRVGRACSLANGYRVRGPPNPCCFR